MYLVKIYYFAFQQTFQNTMSRKIILHVDDDFDDKELIGEAFLEADPSLQLQQFCTTKEGLIYLQQAKQHGILPNLILLDIHMPGMDGKQVQKC